MEESSRVQPFDDALDALAHVQRRKLLVALLEHNPQDDAPVRIVESEDEHDTVQRLVKMEHTHLPKLEKYGFIVWDRERNEVSKGPNFAEIRPLLELLDDHGDELPAGWL